MVPERLHLSATALDGHLDEHRAAHTAANAKITAAASGLVGAAAAALEAKAVDLQAKSLHVTNELIHLRDSFDQCGYAFFTTDDESKIRIFRTRPHEGS